MTFYYSKINYYTSLASPEYESIPLGIIAEWDDGDFWRIALCAVKELKPEQLQKLDDYSRILLEEPFPLLYQMLEQYIAETGWYQDKSILSSLIENLFTETSSFYAEFIYEETLVDQVPEEIFEELSECLQGSTQQSIWFKLSSRDLINSDKTKILE